MKNSYEIPDGWKETKLKDILTIGSGRDYKHLDEGDIPVYGTGGYMLSVDDYLYDGESVGIGRKGTIDKPVFLQGKFWTVDTLFYTHNFKQVLPYYVYLIFQSINWKKYNEATGVPSLSKVNIEAIKILLPPLSEQQKIAEILSTVDDKIKVISQEILEIEELKKGLIQRLLTKGIGHEEYKDSPLGKIPKTWEVKKLKDVAKCFVGIASSATHAYRESGITLVRNQNIKPGKFSLDDVLYVDESYEIQHKSKRLKARDILTVRTGYPGVSAVVPPELEGQQSFTTLITRIKDETVDSDFVCAYINSEKGKNFFTSNQAGGGQKNVGSKTLETMLIPVPSLGEQKRIFEITNAAVEKIEILEKKKFEYEELKKGLSQKLLSGQIRVDVPIEA